MVCGRVRYAPANGVKSGVVFACDSKSNECRNKFHLNNPQNILTIDKFAFEKDYPDNLPVDKISPYLRINFEEEEENILNRVKETEKDKLRKELLLKICKQGLF